MAYSKEWWHIDANGLRIGFMEPVEFENILAGYYGDRKWVPGFAKDFGLSLPTLYNYKSGEKPIPLHIALIVRMLVKIGGPENLPKVHAPWLPVDPSIPKDYKQTRPKKDED